MVLKSGQVCPENGIWVLDGYAHPKIRISKGQTFPKINGHLVNWKLLIYI